MGNLKVEENDILFGVEKEINIFLYFYSLANKI